MTENKNKHCSDSDSTQRKPKKLIKIYKEAKKEAGKDKKKIHKYLKAKLNKEIHNDRDILFQYKMKAENNSDTSRWPSLLSIFALVISTAISVMTVFATVLTNSSDVTVSVVPLASAISTGPSVPQALTISIIPQSSTFSTRNHLILYVLCIICDIILIFAIVLSLRRNSLYKKTSKYQLILNILKEIEKEMEMEYNQRFVKALLWQLLILGHS